MVNLGGGKGNFPLFICKFSLRTSVVKSCKNCFVLLCIQNRRYFPKKYFTQIAGYFIFCFKMYFDEFSAIY